MVPISPFTRTRFSWVVYGCRHLIFCWLAFKKMTTQTLQTRFNTLNRDYRSQVSFIIYQRESISVINVLNKAVKIEKF